MISPLYANIYLHYVLDLWVQQWRKKFARGEAYVVRYVDDSIYCFQNKTDAKAFHYHLRKRLEKFGLSLNVKKTRLIEFGRFAKKDCEKRKIKRPETFTFLGFTHICSERISDGGFTIFRKTYSKTQSSKLTELKKEMGKRRCIHIHHQGMWLRAVVTGFYNYFGVPRNIGSLDRFRSEVCRAWLKSLKRRSQKSTLNWAKFQKLVKRYIPSAKITHPYPNQRFYV